ncbi:APC family permease [Subtercola endophyticus]|uniref:APC family permease n=1 Tax=Subtercola endophyticus TaxID=2895559 RepID=UPI001E54466F|nr:amino acid permease [Subtercola endophyticus]UFS57930.1 amino acid permease [Subtercola endophyticus]
MERNAAARGVAAAGGATAAEASTSVFGTAAALAAVSGATSVSAATPAPGASAAAHGGASPAAGATVRGGTVGLAQGSALYIAAVLGTGILVLPALAAQVAGPASILAVGALIVLSVPLAGTFAALAARFPDAGGVATFVRLALGRTAARMTGYWFFFGVSVGLPVVALLGAEYVVAVLGVERWVGFVIAPLFILPSLVLNAFGLRVSGRVQLGLSALLVIVVVGVIVLAAPATKASNFEPLLPHGWAGVGVAISLFVWAFAGWEAVTHIAGEFVDPRRVIPRATAIAIVVVGAAYLGLQIVTVGVLGGAAGASAVPLLDLVQSTAPSWARIVVAAIAGVVALGVLNAYVGAFAKLGASLGREGDLPRWFSPGAEVGGLPRRALLLVAGLAAVDYTLMVFSGGALAPFILVHTSCMVAVYALGVVAALRLLRRFSAGWWMSGVSVLLVAGLLALAGPHLLAPAVLAAAALLVTVVSNLHRKKAS